MKGAILRGDVVCYFRGREAILEAELGTRNRKSEIRVSCDGE